MRRYRLHLILFLCMAPLFIHADDQPLSPFGIMGFSYSHAYAAGSNTVWKDSESHLTLFETTGAEWARQDFWWSIVEPEKDTWNWEYFDKAMQSYKKHDINLLAILCYGSNWYKDAPVTAEEQTEFGEYVFKMVSRYKDICTHWEIWNEPNILPFWAPKPRAKDYVELLKISYTQAKRADPDCVVIGGVFAGADDYFLSEMYTHGAKGYFDVLSYHTYGNEPKEEDLIAQVEDLKRVMRQNNDMKPIWCTETGIFTGPGGVTEQEQAERSVKETITLISAGVEKVFQLTLKDWFQETEAVDGTSFRGLFKANSTPKKFFHAFKTMTNLLTDSFYKGRVDILEGVRGHLFETPEGNILILWATNEPVDKKVDLGVNSVMLIRMEGATSKLESASGVYELSITGEPMYLRGIKEKIQFLANIQFEEGSNKIKFGGKSTLKVALENPLKRELKGSVSITVPEGLTVDKKSIPVNLSPRGKGIADFEIHTTDKIGLGTYYASLTFKSDDASINEVSAHKDIDVMPPLSIEFEPIQRLESPEGTISFMLSNHLDREISGSITLDSNVAVKDVPSEMTLAPQESKRVSFKVKTSEIKPATLHTFDAAFTSDKIKTSDEIQKRFLFVPYVTGEITIDGDLSEWKNMTKNITYDMLEEVDFNPNLTKGEEDIAANGWLAYDTDFLYLALEVNDDVIDLPESVTIWDHDSLQVAIDGLHDARPGDAFDNKNDFEFQIALWRNGKLFIDTGQFPPGRIESVVQEIQMSITKSSDNTMIYEIAIPAPILLPLELEPATVFGFNFIINDNDGAGREGWLELQPGIGWGKEPYNYYGAILGEK